MNFVNKAERVYVRLWYLLTLLYWTLAIPFSYLAEFDPVVREILTPASMFFAVAFTFFGYSVRNLKWLRLGQFFGLLVFNFILCFATRLDVLDGTGNRAVVGFWIVGVTLGVGVLAFRNYAHIAMMSIYLALLAVGVQGYPEPLLGWGFGAVLILASSNAQIMVHRSLKRETINSFRQQSICTPKQVLINAIQTGRTVSEVFGPEDRASVCICSDWRQFQAFSARVTANKLAKVLEAYYTLQIQLLDVAFPEGNYFIDWIADELFVVGFATATSDEGALAESAVAFARSSLEGRIQFSTTYGAPEGLDIGISRGIATVGMLGPKGNKKATALGAVAGLARRLQTVAKELRLSEGAMDRVVLHPNFASVLKYTDAYTTMSLPRGLLIKDLDVAQVLVLQSTNTTASSPEFHDAASGAREKLEGLQSFV